MTMHQEIDPLATARERYEELRERHRQCCGGESNYPSTHFYFHGKYWEGTYPKDERYHVWMEMGAAFWAHGATTYYIFDNDSTSDSVEYGDTIPYAAPDFWERLIAQLDDAPRAAWEDDVVSCEVCGYHYHAGWDPCHDQGDDDQGDDDQGDDDQGDDDQGDDDQGDEQD